MPRVDGAQLSISISGRPVLCCPSFPGHNITTSKACPQKDPHTRCEQPCTVTANYNQPKAQQPLHNPAMAHNSSSASGNQTRDYAASMSSGSTGYSYTKEPTEEASPKPASSLRQKVKAAFQDMGHPPTYRYDMQNSPRPAELGGPFGSNQRGSRT
jgi:hypothetical protein